MLRLVLQRALLGVLTLWIVSILVFSATQALPGDAARAILGRNATPASLAALRKELNLGSPLLSQYGHWLRETASGRLGTSLAAREPVAKLIGDRVVNSFILVLVASLLGIPLALVIGVYSAMRRDRLFDHTSSLAMLTVAALPEFVVGISLVLVFATNIAHLLPAVSFVDPSRSIWRQLDLIILPAVTLVLAVAPYISRMIRASMVEVLESDYVAMARLKGLPEQRVVVRHAVMNGAGPTLQAIAISLAYLAGGIVVVESVFRFPGIGSALVDAVRSRDLPVIQALSLLMASVYIVVNLIADIVTVLVTPKLRTSL